MKSPPPAREAGFFISRMRCAWSGRMPGMQQFCDTAGMPLRHAPPAVRHPLKPPRGLSACLWALWLLAAMLLLAWVLSLQSGWRPAVVAVTVSLVAAAGLWHGWRALGRGFVAWDGVQWWLGATATAHDAQPVLLQVRADGGQWLWAQAIPVVSARPLRWQSPRWLLLSYRQSPETWGDLRRAVYFPPRPTERAQ